jgi:aromatic-L-amino-acid decarboxylase
MDARQTPCASPAAPQDLHQDRTLDPATPAEWNELRAEAHRILDETLDNLQGLRTQPAWQPMTPAIEQALDEAPAPHGERSLGAVYAEVASRILPYTSANRHPRAWGWVRGQGTPVAMLADMIASAANAHVGGGHTAPVHVERTVIRWLAEGLEMRGVAAADGSVQAPSGLLTSGATMANLLGLAVARHARAPFDVRAEGLAGQPRLTLYCSTETHIWATKAVELLGLGRRSLRMLPADKQGRLPLDTLRAAVEKDRAEGACPLAVIANAGTVNTGAFDDFAAIRTLCDELGLWMHVDGAFGALLKLTPTYRSMVAGMEQADSVAFDLHKWMYLPFETGCLLVRDAAAHHDTFRTTPAYMERGGRGMLAGELSFSDLGIESSRSFKALRVWMQLSVHGLAKHGELIEQNMEQAAYLEASIRERSPELEMMAPRPANIVCFRYCPGAETCGDTMRLNALNRAITHALQESGRFVVSGTTLHGAYALRVAITNHRSRREDFAALAAATVATGRRLARLPYLPEAMPR